MKEIVASFVAIIVLGVAANYALKEVGFSSSQKNSSQAVRLD